MADWARPLPVLRAAEDLRLLPRPRGRQDPDGDGLPRVCVGAAPEKLDNPVGHSPFGGV